MIYKWYKRVTREKRKEKKRGKKKEKKERKQVLVLSHTLDFLFFYALTRYQLTSVNYGFLEAKILENGDKRIEE